MSRYLTIFFCILFFGSSSCKAQNCCLYKSKVKAYENAVISPSSTGPHIISISVNTGKMDYNTGLMTKNNPAQVVIPLNTLFYIKYGNNYLDDMEELFSAQLFWILTRQSYLHVTEEEFERLKPYLISAEDAEKYLRLNTRKLFKENTEDIEFEKGITLTMAQKKMLKNAHLKNGEYYSDNYNVRCVMHNLLHNGYSIRIDCESGIVIIEKE